MVPGQDEQVVPFQRIESPDREVAFLLEYIEPFQMGLAEALTVLSVRDDTWIVAFREDRGSDHLNCAYAVATTLQSYHLSGRISESTTPAEFADMGFFPADAISPMEAARVATSMEALYGSALGWGNGSEARYLGTLEFGGDTVKFGQIDRLNMEHRTIELQLVVE